MRRKFVNPFMVWLLQSPLHFFVSKRIMLISVIGRKSGKVYTTPVEYGLENDTAYVITGQNYAWWKNLRGGGQAKLVVQGKPLVGKAQISDDAQMVLDTFRKIYPNRSGFERVAQGCVAIRISLTH